MPAITADTTKAKSLIVLDPVAEEPRAALGVADRDHDLAELGD